MEVAPQALGEVEEALLPREAEVEVAPQALGEVEEALLPRAAEVEVAPQALGEVDESLLLQELAAVDGGHLEAAVELGVDLPRAAEVEVAPQALAVAEEVHPKNLLLSQGFVFQR